VPASRPRMALGDPLETCAVKTFWCVNLRLNSISMGFLISLHKEGFMDHTCFKSVTSTVVDQNAPTGRPLEVACANCGTSCVSLRAVPPS
jgi:hypothetical protein